MAPPSVPPPLTLSQHVAATYLVGHGVLVLLPLPVLAFLDVSGKGLHLPLVVLVQEKVSDPLLLQGRRQLDVGPVPELRLRLPFFKAHRKGCPPRPGTPQSRILVVGQVM